MAIRETEIEIANRRVQIADIDNKIQELKISANGSYAQEVKDILALRSSLSRQQVVTRRYARMENRRREILKRSHRFRGF